MFDLSAFGLDANAQAAILQGAVIASAVLPLAQKLADHTKNKYDNQVVGALASILRFLPRVRTGK